MIKSRRTYWMKVAGMFYLLFFLCVFSSQAQDAKTDFDHIRNYMTGTRLYMEINYAVYDQADTKTKLESSDAAYYMWPSSNSILKYKETETYQNERYVVVVNNTRKLIIVNKAGDQKTNDNLAFSISDSLLKQFTKIELMENSPGKRSYRVYFKLKTLPYDHIDLIFNPDTYQLTKVIMYYTKNIKQLFGANTFSKNKESVIPLVEISYNNYRVLKEDEKQLFYAKQVLDIDTKGNVTLKEAFKKYQLANYYTLKK